MTGDEINMGIIRMYSAEFGDIPFEGPMTATEVLHRTSTGRSFTEQQMVDMIREVWDNSEIPEFVFVGTNIEPSSPLRDEDDDGTDTMGAETDPMAMGSGEEWFRNLRGE